ncbi:MAG: GIN domain-containing protein [Emticicia sp.]|uniref:GIN domain-containing protein n=1 Tax=Emticicia sp. TaxID=1930953 RepID=UPI003BA4A78B
MKKLILIITLFNVFCTVSFAQKGPLRGTGKLISRTFDFKDFDKVTFEDFDGKIEVEIGKPFSIKVDIDENLEPRLEVLKEEAENQLTIRLAGNYNGKLYLEDTRIKIKVTMPEASVIKHRGNTNVQISGVLGRYFRLENDGNGDVMLQGNIDELDIKKNGNGNVNAQKLIAKTAKVKSYGNGNVSVNSQISLIAHGTGNNSVMQFGQGKIDPMSGIIGNGEVRKM